ncbi:hypothetical protein OS493_035698, partial [Desmophyllum pertusum]
MQSNLLVHGWRVLQSNCVGSLVEGATTDELVDSFNTDDDDNEAEGSTLVEYGNELVEGDVPTKLWVSDDVTGATADELVDSFNTDDDDNEAEGSTLVEYGNELVEGDVLTKLWISDDVTGAIADELLVDSFNTEDEKPAVSMDDDDEREGSTLVEYGSELVEGDVPTKLWVFDDVTGATADEL